MEKVKKSYGEIAIQILRHFDNKVIITKLQNDEEYNGILDTKINKQAFSEVYDILKHSENQIYEKIPNEFMKVIIDNMDIDYKVNIDYNTNINYQPLMKETKAILSLIYRDYLCDERTKDEILKNDKNELQKEEEKKIGLNDIEKIFLEKRNKKETITENTNFPSNYKKMKWYETIFLKFLKVFNNTQEKL